MDITKIKGDLGKRLKRDLISILTRAITDLDEAIPRFQPDGDALKKMEGWREAARVALEALEAAEKINIESLGMWAQNRITETFNRAERDQREWDAEEAAFLKKYLGTKED